MMTEAVTVETAARLLPESDTRPFSLFSLLPVQRKTFNSVFELWGVEVCHLLLFSYRNEQVALGLHQFKGILALV